MVIAWRGAPRRGRTSHARARRKAADAAVERGSCAVCKQPIVISATLGTPTGLAQRGRAAWDFIPHGRVGHCVVGVGLALIRGRSWRGSWDGIARIMGWFWRGLGMVQAWWLWQFVQKNAKKMQKNAILFAFVKKKQYLCIGFGNSPSHNH